MGAPPAFTDQPRHETAAWAEEFLARYCQARLRGVRLEVRVGRREEDLRLAEEIDSDLTALGWWQELAPGRAPVVRTMLEHGRVPVLLVPVYLAAAGVGTAERSESWTS